MDLQYAVATDDAMFVSVHPGASQDAAEKLDARLADPNIERNRTRISTTSATSHALALTWWAAAAGTR